MRQMAKNRQRMWYALYEGQGEVYETDSNGDIVYEEIDGDQVPVVKGWGTNYSNPVMFYGNINSGNVGVSIARAYGVSIGDFEAVLCMRKGELPIDELSLIWYNNEPQFNADGSVNPDSADYKVKRVPPCLDEIIYLLGRLDNNGEE